MADLLFALLLSVVAVFLLVRASHPLRGELAAFPSTVRRVLALSLLMGTLALACFAPLFQYPTIDPEQVPQDLPFSFFLAGHALLVTFLVLWWWLSGRPRLEKFLVFRRDALGEGLRVGFVWGVGAWMTTIFVMAVVGTLTNALDPDALPEQDSLPATVGRIVELSWLQRLILVLSAGIVEEAFFRSFLQTRTGLVVSTLLFTTSHMTYGLPLMLVGVFTVSLIFALLFRARKDVVPCMVAHSTFDGIQLFLILPAMAAGS